MSKHTPGPWHHGEIVAEVKTCIWNSEKTTHIADVDDSDVGIDEQQANVRLIAAAPELLAACKELLEHAERDIKRLNDQMVGGLYAAINAAKLYRARDAIAKAEGS